MNQRSKVNQFAKTMHYDWKLSIYTIATVLLNLFLKLSNFQTLRHGVISVPATYHQNAQCKGMTNYSITANM